MLCIREEGTMQGSEISHLHDLKIMTKNGTQEADEDLKFLLKDHFASRGNSIAYVDARFANSPDISSNVQALNNPSVNEENLGLIMPDKGTPRAMYVIEGIQPDPMEAERPVIAANEVGSVYGDPYFSGFEGNGEGFLVSGEQGEIYNIFSDKEVQINGQFVDGGGPVTVLGNVGAKIRRNKIQYFVNGTPPMVNSREIKHDQTIRMGRDTAHWDAKKNLMTITTKEYVFKMTPGKVEVSINDQGVFKDGIMPHGFLGQTADADDEPKRITATNTEETYQGVGAYPGTYKDYAVSDFFNTDDKFSSFGKDPEDLEQAA